MKAAWLVVVAVAAFQKPAFGDDDQLDASEAESARPETPWNEINLGLFTVRPGFGLLLDWATYDQSAASHEQMPLSADEKLRDFRFLLKGKLLVFPRITYTAGYMYDGSTQTWHWRQTGLMFAINELGGRIFVGRTKEGFSTNKLMTGYFGWTLERAAANDAFLPILADGVKWDGVLGDFVYNAGYFIDYWSETENFNKHDKQFATRVVWLPLRGSGKVLHLASEFRWADSNNGFLRYRSKPESFPAQSYAVDTGKFAADSSTMAGFEAYWRPGSLMFGAEYFLNWVQSDPTHNPFFHGGEVFASYILTGEVRPYNEKGAFFEGLVPAHPVESGGIGAWELVLRGSYVDLDGGTIEGGKFWRITPVVSWYLNEFLRFEAEYGYGQLDRFGTTQATQFVQARFALTVM
jgi:phosphate-selective porin OprO/OprP